MPDMRIAVIDPAAGAAGDMFLGALVACGAPVERLTTLPARLGLGEEVAVEVAEVFRGTIRATKVTVRVRGEVEGPGDAPEAGHHGHGPHRHVAELVARIEGGDLTSSVRTAAVAVFRLLAEAEGRVHGRPPESVSLHEVGAWDALIDVVGTVEGFEALGVSSIHHRPPATGRGWVHTAHGQMAVPTPATSLLLEGMELGPDGPVVGEAVTPTGAALLRALSAGAPPERWRPIRQGWGAGTRDPAGYANVMRLVVAERVAEAAEVVSVGCDLDDLPPEYLEPLREALVAAGALDVQAWPVMMKKGRLGLRLEALAPPAAEGAVTDALLRHGTTGGVRRVRMERTVLPRRTIEVPLEGGTVRVKVLEAPGGPRYKPEYDDVTALARRTETPALAVAQRAHDLARRLDGAGLNEEQQ